MKKGSKNLCCRVCHFIYGHEPIKEVSDGEECSYSGFSVKIIGNADDVVPNAPPSKRLSIQTFLDNVE